MQRYMTTRHFLVFAQSAQDVSISSIFRGLKNFPLGFYVELLSFNAMISIEKSQHAVKQVCSRYR